MCISCIYLAFYFYKLIIIYDYEYIYILGIEIEDNSQVRMLSCGEIVEAYERARTKEGRLYSRFSIINRYIALGRLYSSFSIINRYIALGRLYSRFSIINRYIALELESNY